MPVNGILSEQEKSFQKILIGHYDSLKEHFREIGENLETDMASFALQVKQLNKIYIISTMASCTIITKIGININAIKTAEHIFSLVGLCSGNNESVKKRNTYLSA